jgi:serine/threonine protein kinase
MHRRPPLYVQRLSPRFLHHETPDTKPVEHTDHRVSPSYGPCACIAFDGRRAILMASQGCEAELLQHWFPSAAPQIQRTVFTEKDFRDITIILARAGELTYSCIPRIYTVLRLIGRLDKIDNFVQHGISDTWFPFVQRSLPEGLHCHSDRTNFLNTQRLVCNTKALNLERTGTRHGHFPDPDEIPLRKIGDLGKGASGFVERVISTVTHREYALKLIRRGTTFRQDKRVLRDFENELFHLKTLSRGHIHIIDLIGSYTEPKYVGILFPVAACNLAELLNDYDIQSRRWTFRTWFGCLTSALKYLHDNNVRHKDIKPPNILVSDDNQPLLSDFGVSIDWTRYGQSTTVGPTAMTPRYCSPEVAAYEPRNSSSDIWSLGCVFLEIWTALKGCTMKELTKHFTVQGRLQHYHSSQGLVRSWIKRVSRLSGPDSDNLPAGWIQTMLERNPKERWSAHVLMQNIYHDSIEPSAKYLYIGRCCLDDGDTVESVFSSDDADLTTTTTKALSVRTAARGTTSITSHTISETTISSLPGGVPIENGFDEICADSLSTTTRMTSTDAQSRAQIVRDISTTVSATQGLPVEINSIIPTVWSSLQSPIAHSASQSAPESETESDLGTTTLKSLRQPKHLIVTRYAGDGQGDTLVPCALVSKDAIFRSGYQRDYGYQEDNVSSFGHM